MLSRSLPYWPIDPSLSASPWLNFQLDLVRCLWAILPAACLWGASFPLALVAPASRGQDPGRLVGGVYAANTLGAIMGATGFSVLLIAWLGTRRAQQVLIGISAVSALVMFESIFWQAWRTRKTVSSHNDPSERPLTLRTALALLTLPGLAVLPAWSVPEVPKGLIAYGRYLATWTYLPDFLYVGEGMNASVAVSEYLDGTRSFHVSGKVEASSASQDMRLQRMLGHIPGLMHPHPGPRWWLGAERV